jgi:hypothetical protein
MGHLVPHNSEKIAVKNELVGTHLPRSNLEDIIIAKVGLDTVLEAQPSRGGEAIRVWGRGIVGDGRRGPSTSHDLLFNLH